MDTIGKNVDVISALQVADSPGPDELCDRDLEVVVGGLTRPWTSLTDAMADSGRLTPSDSLLKRPPV
jgi:hypothetical protein